MINRQLFKCVAMLVVSVSPAAAQTNWHVVKTFPIGGEGRWDYVTIDSPRHRLFVTRTTHSMAIDVVTGKVLGDISGQILSHGVALAPELGRGFISDGGGKGAIIVFDSNTYAVLGHIAAVPDTDGIIYDPKVKKVITVSGDEGTLMTLDPNVDPQTGKIDPPIALGGKPEFFASDGKGRVYVSLESKDVVAVVDLNSRKVVARWPTAPGGHPVGMSIDPQGRHLFVGCRNPKKMIVINTETGAVAGSPDVGHGVDSTGYLDGQGFASGDDGTLAVIGQSNGQWKVETIVTTPEGSRNLGVDATTKLIYLPAGDFEKDSNGKSKLKPGSFKIIEVGR